MFSFVIVIDITILIILCKGNLLTNFDVSYSFVIYFLNSIMLTRLPSNDDSPLEKYNKLEFKPLITSSVMACVGKHCTLAKKNSISFKEIVQYPLFLYDKGYTVHQRIIDTISQYGDLNILFASNNSLAGKQILSEEVGIGFFTKMTIKSDPYFTTGVLVLLELEDHKINHHYGYIKEKIATYQILTRSLFAPYLPIYNTS